MNRRLEQLCAEILRLYRQQLYVLGKIARLEDVDLRQYDSQAARRYRRQPNGVKIP